MTAVLDTRIPAGTHVRIHASFPALQWMHGLTGEIVAPATEFTGNGWTADGDMHSVRLDDGDREVINVFTSMLVVLSDDSDDSQNEDDDEFECDDECCRGPLDGRGER